MSTTGGPDRYSTCLGKRVAIMQPAGVPKAREECQPFSFELFTASDPRNVKAQEKFVKGLERVSRPKRASRKLAVAA